MVNNSSTEIEHQTL